MWCIVADGVACLLVCNIREPYKMAEAIRCHLGRKLGWANELRIRWGVEILPQEGALLRGMIWRFSCMLPSTVPSGPDIKVSPHAVHQHSEWPAADTVKCHIKFSQWNIPRNAASRQYSLTACLYLQSNDKDMLMSWYSAHFLTTQNYQWLSNHQWLCTTLILFFMYTTLQPLSNCCTNKVE